MPSASRSGHAGHTHDGAAFTPDERARMDPYLLLVVKLIAQQDWGELRFRTGIRHDGSAPAEAPHALPLLVELSGREHGLAAEGLAPWVEMFGRFRLRVPSTSFAELGVNRELRHVTATLELDAKDPRFVAGTRVVLAAHLRSLLADPCVARLHLAAACHPLLETSMQHLGLAPQGAAGTAVPSTLAGKGVVVGIVDDGCAFAHRHVLVRKPDGSYASRIRALWDQSRAPDAGDAAVGWTAPTIQGPGEVIGRELGRAAIEAAINMHIDAGGGVDERAVYRRLRYEPGAVDELSSHGTHVMDIAAGNGSLARGWSGVAPEADIVFVQLPPVDVARPGPALAKAIVDAIEYVFAQAAGQPAVVNLSFGGNRGPHHAGYVWSRILDDVLALPNRALVVAAGNGFEQRTHAQKRVRAYGTARVRWQLSAEDATPNDVEIWYRAGASFELTLVAPDGSAFGPFTSGDHDIVRPQDGAIVGRVEFAPGVDDACVLLSLRPTADEDPAPAAPAQAQTQQPAPAVLAPAQHGTWTIALRNLGATSTGFHAWIQRDDLASSASTNSQSRFDARDAEPSVSIADFACGRRVVGVGAFNCATGEMSRYSSAGPTRRDPGGARRRKPDVCAPAEETADDGGVLSASSLRALPTRMNGTSAAAPHVTGLVALLFEHARSRIPPRDLTADEIRAALAAGGHTGSLRPHAGQAVDDRVRIKQQARLKRVIGGGRVDFRRTLRKLFP